MREDLRKSKRFLYMRLSGILRLTFACFPVPCQALPSRAKPCQALASLREGGSQHPDRHCHETALELVYRADIWCKSSWADFWCKPCQATAREGLKTQRPENHRFFFMSSTGNPSLKVRSSAPHLLEELRFWGAAAPQPEGSGGREPSRDNAGGEGCGSPPER